MCGSSTGLLVSEDANIGNLLTTQTLNVTQDGTVNNLLTANSLDVTKNCNISGNLIVTGNATIVDSCIVKGQKH